FTHPGTKLLFMGGEFGQSTEWNHERSLDWHLLDYDVHKGVQSIVRDLNAFYKDQPALYKYQFEQRGFSWIDYSDQENSIVAYQRQADTKEDLLIVVCNFTPEVRQHYRVGVPYRGQWKEVFNSDDLKYSGAGILNSGLLMTSPVKYHGKDYSVSLTLPPLAITVLKLEKELNEFDLDAQGS
ncbi:MAG TPA: alpha amylase C-terminal domain-containing protein, partial [Chryseolinea sp.]|nr:alpha amylase C-terminal domain-containing protein [Chryseolinea sp.]